MNETWREIKGFNGLYEVSNLGNVRSLWGRYKNKKYLKKTLTGKSKYYTVSLTKGEKQGGYPYLVHRLVAGEFPEICGEMFDGCEIHHKDFNCLNNRADNLVVMTKQEHFALHGTEESFRVKGEKQRNRPDCSKQIFQYTLDMQYVDDYPSSMEASRKTGKNAGHIRRCARGEIPSFSGFIWRFKE